MFAYRFLIWTHGQFMQLYIHTTYYSLKLKNAINRWLYVVFFSHSIYRDHESTWILRGVYLLSLDIGKTLLKTIRTCRSKIQRIIIVLNIFAISQQRIKKQNKRECESKRKKNQDSYDGLRFNYRKRVWERTRASHSSSCQETSAELYLHVISS